MGLDRARAEKRSLDATAEFLDSIENGESYFIWLSLRYSLGTFEDIFPL